MMTGIASAGAGVGTVIMPPLVAWLISVYHWRTASIIVGITNLVLIILAAQFFRRDPGQVGLSPYGGSEIEKDKIDLEAGSFSVKQATHTRQFWLLCAVLGVAGIIFTSLLKPTDRGDLR